MANQMGNKKSSQSQSRMTTNATKQQGQNAQSQDKAQGHQGAKQAPKSK